MKNAQDSGAMSTSLGARMFWEYYLKSVLPDFPIIPSRSRVRSLAPSSLSLLASWGYIHSPFGDVYGTPSDPCLKGPANSHACLVYKMVTRKWRWGQGAKRCQSFYLWHYKEVPGRGPAWSLREYKMQTCAFCWWGARRKARHTARQQFTSAGCTVARKNILVVVVQGRVTHGCDMGQRSAIPCAWPPHSLKRSDPANPIAWGWPPTAVTPQPPPPRAPRLQKLVSGGINCPHWKMANWISSTFK